MKMNSFNFSTTKAAESFAAAIVARVEQARDAGIELAAPVLSQGRTFAAAAHG